MEKINYLLPEESAEMTLNQVKSLRQIEGRLRKLFSLKIIRKSCPQALNIHNSIQHLKVMEKLLIKKKCFSLSIMRDNQLHSVMILHFL